MKPSLTVVCGAPGAGKTTYAAALAPRSGAALLELDTVSEPIIQAALSALGRDPNDRDSAFYKATFREPIYEALFALAEENLRHTDVILVGPFTSELGDPHWRDALTARFRTQVAIHYIHCTPAMRQERLRRRANPRDMSKLSDWASHLAYYAGTEAPACPHHSIDTSETA